MRASGLLFLCYLTVVLGVSFPLPSAEPEVGDDRGGGGEVEPGDDRGRGRGGEVEADNDNDDGPKVGNDNGRGRKDGTSDLSNARLRLPLVRPADALDANAGGRIEVSTRRGRERLVINAERLDPGLKVNLLIDGGAGTFQTVVTLTANSHGQARGQWDTKRQALPLGVSSVRELGGRKVLLQTMTGGDLLQGTMPVAEDGALKVRTKRKSSLENMDTSFALRGKGHVDIDFRPDQGRSKLNVELEHVPVGSELVVLIENPATGKLEEVGRVTVRRNGKGELEFETRNGDALPFEVKDVRELFGKPVDVRSSDGNVLFAGAVPSP